MSILKQYSLQIIFAILAFSFVFTMLGVYDTHALPFYMSFTFWAATMATGIITSVLVTPYLMNKALKGRSAIELIIVGSLIASIPVTIVLTVFNPSFSFNSPLKIWGLQYLYVLIISLIVGGIGYPSLKWLGAFGEKEDIEQAEIRAFLQRLPRRFHSATLYAFSAEDHYLRVYTDKGEDLILLRFADALRELPQTKGLQIHRSWWVHIEAVDAVISENGKKLAHLKNDVKAPISRTYLKDAKEKLSF
jgi:hypothetical protein